MGRQDSLEVVTDIVLEIHVGANGCAYHSLHGKLLDLLDGSWSTLLEGYAMDLCKICDQSSVQNAAFHGICEYVLEIDGSRSCQPFGWTS